MAAKNVIYISLAIIIIAMLLFIGITMFKFQSLSDKYVKLEPGMEERIFLVNIGDGDRKYFAEKITEISTITVMLMARTCTKRRLLQIRC